MAIKFPEERTPVVLAQEYYRSRGILTETVDLCGLVSKSRENCLIAINSKRRTNYDAGIVIPYDRDGNYCTIRWLGDNISTFGTRLRDDPKILAPAGPPQVYTPPIVDETKFNGDLYLCESAIKAIALAQYGYYAIAGNGVDGAFTNKGMTRGFPQTLFDANSVKKVVILYDSDWQTNPTVLGSIRRQTIGLRNELGTEFSIVHKALQHDPDDKVWGIDDAIAAKGEEWLHDWLADDTVDELEITIGELQEHFEELNATYTICKIPLAIIDVFTGELYSRSGFTDLVEIYRIYLQKNEKGKWIKIHPAKEWIEWTGRNIVDNLVYRPGEKQIDFWNKPTFYNNWTDCGATAVKGDIQPFLDVFENAIPDREIRELLFQSMAWLLQNRTEKLDKAFLLIGAQVGTGKSLFAQIMGEIVGRRNFSSIGMEDFVSNHNSPFVEKEIILMDDVTEMPRSVVGKFRRYVTDKTLIVNTKMIKQYTVENQAIWFITANKYKALPMDDNERRVLVVDFSPTTHYPTGSVWWDRFIEWLEGGGYGIIRYYLESLDLSKFNPNYMPPMTDVKRKVQAAGRTAEEQFVRDLWDDPESVLGNRERSVYSIKELWSIYGGPDGEAYSTGRASKLSTALRESSFSQAHEGGLIRVAGESSRYWVVKKRGQLWPLNDVKEDVSTNRDITPTT